MVAAATTSKMSSIANNLEHVCGRMAAAAQRVNRSAEEIELVAVSKTHDAGRPREGSKFGFKPDQLRQDIEFLLQLPRLTIEGLMTIPPLAPAAEDSRHFFVQLRELRDQLEQEFDVRFPQLSMGMTNDFEVAIEEGATFVRVGTAIFGERTTFKTRRVSEMAD